MNEFGVITFILLYISICRGQNNNVVSFLHKYIYVNVLLPLLQQNQISAISFINPEPYIKKNIKQVNNYHKYFLNTE